MGTPVFADSQRSRQAFVCFRVDIGVSARLLGVRERGGIETDMDSYLKTAAEYVCV